MGQKCAHCGKVWALRKADPDGIYRCMRHTQQPRIEPRAGRKHQVEIDSAELIDNRAKLIHWLSKHAKAASAAHAAGIGKTLIAAIQMIDPMAPEQELGAFIFRVVTADRLPDRTERKPPDDPALADAE